MKKIICFVCLLGLLGAANLVFAGTLVQFHTARGVIDVELYDQDKPVTVQNFLRYWNSGAYSNTFFHSCISTSMVVGGGYKIANTNLASQFTGASPIAKFAAITNEFFVGPRYLNTFGTLAMLKDSASANSATSQFFFNLANNTNLDTLNGGYTVFGHIISASATNVLNGFTVLSTGGNGIFDESAHGAAFANLPVTYFGGVNPKYPDLFYIDTTLVKIKESILSGKRQQLSWGSVNGRVNLVEYSTTLPPNWQLLIATNGDGSTMSVINSTTNGAARFYRVRVGY